MKTPFPPAIAIAPPRNGPTLNQLQIVSPRNPISIPILREISWVFPFPQFLLLPPNLSPPFAVAFPAGFSVISLAPVPTQSLCSVPDPYTPRRSPNSHQFHSLVPQSNRISAPNESPFPPKPPVIPTPSPGKTFSRSSSSNKIITEESPNLQRWQRMKDRLTEMNEWLDEMREGEELKVTETEIPVKEDDVLVPNGEEEEEGGGIEEAVWVEKTKECLTLHFKCPCGKGYQILLAHGKCYYKLV